MDKFDIKSLIPHRNSMLLLDDIHCIEDTYAEAVYEVKGTEFFLDGHYPDKKIVPGTILCEMMAQLTAAFVGYTRKIPGVPILAEIKNAKFKKLISSGETLIIKMSILKDFFRVLVAECTIYVDGSIVASAELTVAKK